VPRRRHGLLTTIVIVVAACSLAAPSIASAGSLATGLTTDNRIVTFDVANPGTLLSSTAVVGLLPGEQLLAIDYRPLTGQLYAIGSNSVGYLIDDSGQATQVGIAFGPLLDGTEFGIDFNPTVDRLRIVSNNEQNMRWNPVTGTISGFDTNLSPAGDIGALAYTNNDQDGATPTTAYAIDTASDSLVRLGGPDGTPSPNGGVLTTIGPLGFDTSERVGLDVPLGAGTTAYALLTVGGAAGLYGIDLGTGTATPVGGIGPGGTALRDITVSATAAPVPVTPAPTPAPIPIAAPNLAPRLTALSVTNSVFAPAAAGKRTAKKKTPVGTAFRFTLSETASVRVTFTRAVPGRRVGSRCLGATPERRKRKRCTRFVSVGAITSSGKSGRNTLRFDGRIGGRALAPGSYRATITATDAGRLRSTARTVSLRVVRG